MVGFTTDHRGLIFSVRRGAKSGGFVVQLDDSVIGAVEELRALLADEQAAQADARSSSKRPESALSVREVQARLRRGRTIEQVAREAGVDASWVSRFAVPVLAEQAEVIRAARATRMTKQRVGLSSAPLGDSVYRNLAERGLADPREELDRSWRARQLTEGMWLVTMKYTLRGRESEAVWEYDEVAGALRARGRLGTQLGFREPTRRAPRPATPASPTAPTTRVKKSTTPAAPTTARRSSSRQASKRVAAARRAATARMMSDAEKATRRNAALARKAAKKPVVLPPRLPIPPPPPEPERLIVEDDVEEPASWGDELELAWEDTDADATFDADGDDDVESEADLELEAEDDLEVDADIEVEVEEEDDEAIELEAVEFELEDDDEPEVDADLEDEDELDLDEELEPEPAPAPRSGRRREPLRARPVDPASSAERARRRVRLRTMPAEDTAPDTGNGPVFRGDLAQPAGDLSFPRSAASPSPAPPLSMPLQPIERPPRRRRIRPLRGR
jgi:sRNA-binding protein